MGEAAVTASAKPPTSGPGPCLRGERAPDVGHRKAQGKLAVKGQRQRPFGPKDMNEGDSRSCGLWNVSQVPVLAGPSRTRTLRGGSPGALHVETPQRSRSRPHGSARPRPGPRGPRSWEGEGKRPEPRDLRGRGAPPVPASRGPAGPPRSLRRGPQGALGRPSRAPAFPALLRQNRLLRKVRAPQRDRGAGGQEPSRTPGCLCHALLRRLLVPHSRGAERVSFT